MEDYQDYGYVLEDFIQDFVSSLEHLMTTYHDPANQSRLACKGGDVVQGMLFASTAEKSVPIDGLADGWRLEQPIASNSAQQPQSVTTAAQSVRCSNTEPSCPFDMEWSLRQRDEGLATRSPRNVIMYVGQLTEEVMAGGRREPRLKVCLTSLCRIDKQSLPDQSLSAQPLADAV